MEIRKGTATNAATPNETQGKVTTLTSNNQGSDNIFQTAVTNLNEQEPPQAVGMLSIKTATKWAEEAAARPDPKALYLSMWYEGEACCLFADTNLGKSILAIQVGAEVARDLKLRVLYLDFELSDKQFQLRYTSDDGKIFQFPKNFFRAEIDPDQYEIEGDFETNLMNDIEKSIIECAAKVIIVDNITWMCSESEKGGNAAMLMKRLNTMKKKLNISILVIAHTPKRALTSPLTQNDLAGSKKLINFFDSAFAIGRSAKDEKLRYLKQIKCRFGEFKYDSDNVIVCEIEKDGAFTKFVTTGYSKEREHLQELSDKDDAELESRVKELAAGGKSYRTIAQECGVSLAKVQRIIKK